VGAKKKTSVCLIIYYTSMVFKIFEDKETYKSAKTLNDSVMIFFGDCFSMSEFPFVPIFDFSPF
jgi:hypothetical protein